jgi:Transposase
MGGTGRRARWLRPVRRCTLAHPLGVKAFSCRRVKNDEKDAADLAGLLRMGRLAEAQLAPAEIRELRELTRYRALCRGRHRCRYAEARIMPMRGDRAWELAVAG